MGRFRRFNLLLEPVHVLKDEHGIVLEEGMVWREAGKSSDWSGWRWRRRWRQASRQRGLLMPWRVWPVVKAVVNEACILSSTYLAKDGV